jgi:hypothetical protein
MSKKIFAFLSVLVIASMILVACGPADSGNDNMANNTADNTADNGGNNAANDNTANNDMADDDMADETPAFTTTRTGAWPDQVAMSVVGSDSSITQLEAGAIDLFASSLMTPSEHQAIADGGLTSASTFGLYYELTINPVGPEFPGTGK